MLNINLVRIGGNYNMINISRITINGFKNIKSINILLNKITSLLSINSFGKSNLLSAIDFGFDFISQNEQTRKDMMKWKKGIPLNKNIESKKYEFEFEFSTSIEKELYEVIYGYAFDWAKKDKVDGEITNEYLNIKKVNETQKFTSYIKRIGEEAYYKSSITGSCDKQIKISDTELIINKLKAYDSLFYINIIDIINKVKIYIDRHFDSKINYDISPIVWKDKTLLNEEDSIAKILYNIKENNINKYERLINTFKDLFPFIEDIEVKAITLGPDKVKLTKELDGTEPFEITDKIYRLYAKDKNLSQAIPFDLMSDGAKRVLVILTYLMLADIKNYSLIAIEEPENSVHPRLLQQYLIALDSLLENAKLIITSHSPHLINYINLKNIYIGIPNNEGLANFSKIKESAANKVIRESADLNMLTGDYLFDLMCGTKEDIECLSSYVE